MEKEGFEKYMIIDSLELRPVTIEDIRLFCLGEAPFHASTFPKLGDMILKSFVNSDVEMGFMIPEKTFLEKFIKIKSTTTKEKN